MPKSDSQDFPPLHRGSCTWFSFPFVFPQRKIQPAYRTRGQSLPKYNPHSVTFHEIHSYSYMTSRSHLSTLSWHLVNYNLGFFWHFFNISFVERQQMESKSDYMLRLHGFVSQSHLSQDTMLFSHLIISSGWSLSDPREPANGHYIN